MVLEWITPSVLHLVPVFGPAYDGSACGNNTGIGLPGVALLPVQ